MPLYTPQATSPQAVLPRFPDSPGFATQDDINNVQAACMPVSGMNFRYNTQTGQLQLANETDGKYAAIDLHGAAPGTINILPEA